MERHQYHVCVTCQGTSGQLYSDGVFHRDARLSGSSEEYDELRQWIRKQYLNNRPKETPFVILSLSYLGPIEVPEDLLEQEED